MSLFRALRLAKLGLIWVKYGLDEMVFSLPGFRAFRFIIYLNPLNWLRRSRFSLGERLRLALEEMGPLFIKFGQILSTRQDLLPEAVVLELTKLQDRVPPFPAELAIERIEASLGSPISEIFSEFDPIPVGSASIAQVHSARLKSGPSVVIKVLRPDIEKVLKQDIALLKSLAKVLEKVWPRRMQKLKPRLVVKEIEETVLNEIDLLREAANASTLRRHFKDSPLLVIPQMYWEYCRSDVLVMEKVSGVPCSEVEVLRKAGVNLKKLAERGVDIFYTQVFRDNFFHADMHPGNIWVNWEDPNEPYYVAIDFGIMGTLRAEDQKYLAGNLMAFLNRDYRRVAELHIESGWVEPGTRLESLEAAIRTLCEPLFERPLKDISLGHLMSRLFAVARQFGMEVQPSLLLLQKTLLNVEGMGRQLYPELDLWRVSKPFVEKWMRQKWGLRGFLKRLKERLPDWAERFLASMSQTHD